MTPSELLNLAQDEQLTWIDYYADGTAFNADEREGTDTKLVLDSPLTPEELADFQEKLPAPLPQEIKDLLNLTRGFDVGTDDVFFANINQWGYEFLLPNAVVLSGDDTGNHWVIQVDQITGDWRHVWFQCHDPPVVVYQCETLTEFLDGFLDQYRFQKCLNGHRSFMLESFDLAMEIWNGNNPRQISVAEALKSNDESLVTFAKKLDENYFIVDLRELKIGFGFDWSGVNGNEIIRHETLCILGIPPIRRTLLDRVFQAIGGLFKRKSSGR